jgi:hypothetical protein
MLMVVNLHIKLVGNAKSSETKTWLQFCVLNHIVGLICSCRLGMEEGCITLGHDWFNILYLEALIIDLIYYTWKDRVSFWFKLKERHSPCIVGKAAWCNDSRLDLYTIRPGFKLALSHLQIMQIELSINNNIVLVSTSTCESCIWYFV